MRLARPHPFQLMAVLACLSVAGCADALTSPPVATGRPIAGSTGYPRLVRLLDPSGAATGTLLAASGARLFDSADGGESWQRLGRVPLTPGRRLRCCETLFVLTHPVGPLPTGTVLFAASYFADGVPAIAILASADQGRTWRDLGAPVMRGAPGGHGLWEPAFQLAADGALVLFWSDETDPRHSQKLTQLRSYDGTVWRDETDTVVSDRVSDRPGMPTVSRSPGGRWLLTYEVCGPTLECAVFAKTSTDGWHFGDPHALGTEATTHDGAHLYSAPVNAWSPAPATADGRYLLVARKVIAPDGSTSPLSGATLFAGTDPDRPGTWTPIEAPVRVADIENNACQNYSSALLPSPDGTTLLELAGAFGPNGRCTLYSRRAPLHPFTDRGGGPL